MTTAELAAPYSPPDGPVAPASYIDKYPAVSWPNIYWMGPSRTLRLTALAILVDLAPSFSPLRPPYPRAGFAFSTQEWRPRGHIDAAVERYVLPRPLGRRGTPW